MTGETLLNRFRIIKEIGRGAKGEVFLVKDLSTNELLALKRINLPLESSPIETLRFEKEFVIARSIKSKYVVRMFEFFRNKESVFFTMEYINGIALKDLKDHSLSTIIKIFIMIARALLDLHSYNIIHRDIKPTNIILPLDGGLKILDLGLAHLKNNENPGLSGTINYMAPELFHGGIYDVKSDIYSAGVIFYELLTGNLPFDIHPSNIPISREILNSIDFPETVDPKLKKLILKMINPIIKERLNDALILLNELEQIEYYFFGKEDSSADELVNELAAIYQADFISRRAENAKAINYIDNFIATGVDFSLVIEGDRGVGKTRFLEEIRNKMIFRDINIISVSASETQNLILEIGISLWQILSPKIRNGISKKWGDILLRYFPSLGKNEEFKGITPAETLISIHEELARLVALLGEIFSVATKKIPLILMIDDLNEVDKRSLKVLHEFFIQKEENRSIFLIASISMEGALGTVEFPANTRITIPGFTFAEMKEFIESSLGIPERAIDEELFSWIYRHSGGSVKIARALLYMLRDEKLIIRKGKGIVFKDAAIENFDLDALIGKKLNDMTREEALLLKAASIYRKFTTKASLRYVLSFHMSDAQFETAFDEVKKSFLIEEHKNSKIRFVTTRFQSILYATLPDNIKKSLHLANAAFLLNENLLNDVNALAFAAYHFLRGGNPETALRLYLKSASRTFFHLNTELVGNFVDEALSIIKQYPDIVDEKKKNAIYLFAGKIFYQLGFYTRAALLLENCFKIWKKDFILEFLIFSLTKDGSVVKAKEFLAEFKPQNENEKAFKYYLAAFIYGRAEYDFTKSYYNIQRAKLLISKGFFKLINAERAYLLQELEFEYYFSNKKRSISHLEKLKNELFECAEKLSSKVFIIDAYNIAFSFYWTYGKIEEAYKEVSKTLKLAIGIYDNYRISRAYNNLAVCSHIMGNWNDVYFYLERAMEYARKGCGLKTLKYAYFNRGEFAIYTGDYSLAENYLLNAEELTFRDGQDSDLVFVYTGQIMLYIIKNELGYARQTGGKLRRLLESKKSLDSSKMLKGVVTLFFLESIIDGERDFYGELAKKIEDIFITNPEYKDSFMLLFITAKVINAAKRDDEKEVFNLINIVEKTSISTNYPFYRILYYYYVCLFFVERKPGSIILKKYIEEGRKESAKFQAKNFLSYFSEISYYIEQNESEKLIAELKTEMKSRTSDKKDDKGALIVSKIELYVEETKKQIEYFRIKNRNYAYIVDIVKSIAGKTEIEKIMEIIADKVLEIIGADMVAVVSRYEEENLEYFIKDASTRRLNISEIKFRGNVIPKMLKTAKIEFSSNISQNRTEDLDFSHSTGSVDDDIFSVTAVPIVVQGEIKAFIYFERNLSKGSIREQEINFLELLVDNVGIIFDNVKLIEIATTDLLTHLSTRRHFMNVLKKEIEKAKRYNFPLSLIMLDVDHFKKINDTHGHLMGDQILSKIGNILKYNIRNSDYAGRFGGEEFMVLLTGTDEAGALKTAEKIRTKIENMDFSGINATVSLGIVAFAEGMLADENEFIDKADKALYAAKERGRNRSIIYSDI